MLYIPLAILSAFGMFWGTQAPRGSVPDSVGALEVGLGAVSGLAVDGQGNVYLASRSLNRILRLDPYGRLAIVAGSERSAFALLRNVEVHGGPPPGDKGPAMAAQLDQPIGLALDSSDRLYVAEAEGRRIRRIDLRTGTIETAAGGGDGPGDGIPVAAARLVRPTALVMDPSGDLFFSDTGDQRVRKLEARTGAITTVAGDGVPGASGDGGQAGQARLASPEGLALDAAGNLYIADRGNRSLRRVDRKSGVITTVARDLRFLSHPVSLTVDARGDILVGDLGTRQVLRIRLASGAIERVDLGIEISAPDALAIDARGALFVADAQHFVVMRKAGPAPAQIVAGSGGLGYAGDGRLATLARLRGVSDLAADAEGNVYVADAFDHRVRRIAAGTGTIQTVAGDGWAGFRGDGDAATRARLDAPAAVAVDSFGNLLIADTGNHRVRRVSPAGVISTCAGNGEANHGGDGGPATQAGVAMPSSLAIDAAGNLFVGQGRAGRVRRVDASSGRITSAAEGLDAVSALALDGSGGLWIAEDEKRRVRRVDLKTGLTTSLVDEATVQAAGRDSGAIVYLADPRRMAFDKLGRLHIADAGAGLLRLDRASGRLERVAYQPTPNVAGGLRAILFAGGSMLVGHGSGGLIDRLDDRGEVTHVAGGGFGF